MKRVVAFGCSCTYGHGLPDCFTPPDRPGSQPSKFVWPSVLSSELGLECDNRSRPGASNLEILENILNYNYKEGDAVFVMWTFHEREMLYTDNLERMYLHTGSQEEIQKNWLTLHTDTDFRMRSWFYMYTAHLHLTSLNVKFYFLNINFDKIFHSLRPKWAEKITFLAPNLNMLAKRYPKALDNMHPGPIPQILVAKRIITELNRNE